MELLRTVITEIFVFIFLSKIWSVGICCFIKNLNFSTTWEILCQSLISLRKLWQYLWEFKKSRLVKWDRSLWVEDSIEIHNSCSELVLLTTSHVYSYKGKTCSPIIDLCPCQKPTKIDGFLKDLTRHYYIGMAEDLSVNE